MSEQSKFLLCLDIGNSSAKLGKFDHGVLKKVISRGTKEFLRNPKILFSKVGNEKLPIVYCSVVPEVEKKVISFARENSLDLNTFTWDLFEDLPISYPNPEEIGSDRLANAYAAFHIHSPNSIVVDIGTATTFDVITSWGGYEGGVIAPGPQGYLDFLHWKTALLPQLKVSINQSFDQPFGKSTEAAMRLGVRLGHDHMTRGILDNLMEWFVGKHQIKPKVLLVGGASENFNLISALFTPNLTLEGLALAYQRKHFEIFNS